MHECVRRSDTSFCCIATVHMHRYPMCRQQHDGDYTHSQVYHLKTRCFAHKVCAYMFRAVFNSGFSLHGINRSANVMCSASMTRRETGTFTYNADQYFPIYFGQSSLSHPKSSCETPTKLPQGCDINILVITTKLRMKTTDFIIQLMHTT
jgi:hypothetical protein